ncbi:50S ribosomal protein L31, partial [Streptomyces albidoflavus]
YTGKARVLDTAGRVEQFERRYGRRADRSPLQAFRRCCRR